MCRIYVVCHSQLNTTMSCMYVDRKPFAKRSGRTAGLNTYTHTYTTSVSELILTSRTHSGCSTCISARADSNGYRRVFPVCICTECEWFLNVMRSPLPPAWHFRAVCSRFRPPECRFQHHQHKSYAILMGFTNHSDTHFPVSRAERHHADVPRGEEPRRRDQSLAVLAQQAALGEAAHSRRR